MRRDGPRRRYRIAVVTAAILVALAGCSTVLPGMGGESAAYTASGEELNGTTLQDDHVGALQSAGSFTTRTTLDVASANGSARIAATTLVDLEGDRALRTSRITTDIQGGGELRTDTYTANDESYSRLRLGSGEETTDQYQHATAPYRDGGAFGTTAVNRTAAMNGALARNVGDSIDWTQTGTVERNGTTLTRYEASGTENFTEFRNGTDLGQTGGSLTNLDANVSDLSAVLFVDGEGLIYEFRFDLTGTSGGEEVTLSFVVKTSDVGETSVEAPDWLETARERT